MTLHLQFALFQAVIYDLVSRQTLRFNRKSPVISLLKKGTNRRAVGRSVVNSLHGSTNAARLNIRFYMVDLYIDKFTRNVARRHQTYQIYLVSAVNCLFG